MKGASRWLRAILVSTILICIGVPSILFVLLSTTAVQNKIKEEAQKELSILLNSDVVIGDVAIRPFNRVALFDVTMTDANGETAISVERLGIGVSLLDLFIGDIVVNYVEIIGLNGTLYKPTPDSSLNISNIIEALRSDNDNRPQTRFRLSINSIILRSINFKYDVLSEIFPEPGHFDRNHIDVRNMRADISVPLLSNRVYAADIYRLALKERSGLEITDLRGRLYMSEKEITVSGLSMEMPNSYLKFNDMKLEFPGNNDIKSILSHNSLSFSILSDSYVTPSDISCFFGPLENFNEPMSINVVLKGDVNKVSLEHLQVKSIKSNDFSADITGDAYNILDNYGRRVDIKDVSVNSKGSYFISLLSPEASMAVRTMLNEIGEFSFSGHATISESDYDIGGHIVSNAGNITFDSKATYDYSEGQPIPINLELDITLDSINVRQLFQKNSLGFLSCEIKTVANIEGADDYRLSGNIALIDFDYNGYTYHNIEIASSLSDNLVSAELTSVNDNNFQLAMSASLEAVSNDERRLELSCFIESINPYILNLWEKPGNAYASGYMSCVAVWNNDDYDSITGELEIHDVKMYSSNANRNLLSELKLTLVGDEKRKELTIASDIADLELTGEFRPLKLKGDIIHLIGSLFPSIVRDTYRPDEVGGNNFKFAATVRETELYNDLLNLPIGTLAPVNISGNIESFSNSCVLQIDVPYLRNGKNLFEKTNITLNILGGTTGQLFFKTEKPTSKGPLFLTINNGLGVDSVATSVVCSSSDDKGIKGNMDFLSVFRRENVNGGRADELYSEIQLKRGELEVNDSVWVISPSLISVMRDKIIKVNNLMASRPGQHIIINGIISESLADRLDVQLKNFDLDFLFETLSIDNVTIGGIASGEFRGLALLSSEPHLYTDNLYVENISYNKAVLGNASINSNWVPEGRSIRINADINQANGLHTFIKGDILPMNDSLDINFITNKVNLEVLKPYINAFSQDIKGVATGEMRLWGNFKYIDLSGAMMVDSARMKIDFTNTYYTFADSILINPGNIIFDNISLKDDYGNTAVLNGMLKHRFLKNATFDFQLSNASDFLVFNESEYDNPRWWGEVFANGDARITGAPGIVDISCDMVTAKGTVFNFALTEIEEAGEYTFITIRDRDYLSLRDSLTLSDKTPELVKEFQLRQNRITDDGHSQYNIAFNLNINPDAQINFIMDPVAGDRIRAYGNGDMRISYGSNDESLKIFGSYTLTKGNYNFSLQEIIIKDFIIREGSSIAFRGDPYTAMLDITAVYSLTANLTDLDAMFMNDKDLSRTNVPVNALMHIAGDLHHPDISFDLEFPTLTQDVYRNVKSIISTEDMMNRQIIYLLALNRFYTPEYMASTTKGNELISVASSTLSSQLSNILGQISDKWTISPSIKSERSDFSDMEFDLALSSSLLNNRLLLNGNFGYRDKTLNSNQFIGDFDIEYLLNRMGTIRLKAYNRYNDRNFYYKTAATTQGVGIVFKHDFDNFMNIFRLLQKRKWK